MAILQYKSKFFFACLFIQNLSRSIPSDPWRAQLRIGSLLDLWLFAINRQMYLQISLFAISWPKPKVWNTACVRARKSCQLSAVRFSSTMQNSSEISKVNHQECPSVNFSNKAGALLMLSMIYKVCRSWAWTSPAQYSLFIRVSQAELSFPHAALGWKQCVIIQKARASPATWGGENRHRDLAQPNHARHVPGRGSSCATSHWAHMAEQEV